jgi:hypothetical protein
MRDHGLEFLQAKTKRVFLDEVKFTCCKCKKVTHELPEESEFLFDSDDDSWLCPECSEKRV